jgi:hypothetical protein
LGAAAKLDGRGHTTWPGFKPGALLCTFATAIIKWVDVIHSPPGLIPSLHKLYLHTTFGVYITK